MERKRELFGPVFWGAMSCYVIGYGAATLSGHFKRSSLEDKANERIEQVQEHNAQLLDELEPDFPGMGRLVLNDETDTFEFHVTSKSEQAQTCSGDYEVTENTARPVGDIACTSMVQLDGS